MPIITQEYDYDSNEMKQVTRFVGRVVCTETRVLNINFSDTLDYSNYRMAEVFYAIVAVNEGDEIAYSKKAKQAGFEAIKLRVLSPEYYGGMRGNAPDYECVVDAPELFSMYQEHLAILKKIEEENKIKSEREITIKNLRIPFIGGRAKVISGRKVPIGLIGHVVWLGQDNYGSKIGIKDSNNKVHYTASKNVVGLIDAHVDYDGENYSCGCCDFHEEDFICKDAQDMLVHLDLHFERGEKIETETLRMLQGALNGKSYQNVRTSFENERNEILKSKMFVATKYPGVCSISNERVSISDGYAKKNEDGKWKLFNHEIALRMVREK